MTTQPFSGPRLKVERANHHITDLNRKINTFKRRKPYQLVIENYADPGMCRLVIRVRQELPSEFPAIIGDAVHNLRSALDLLACDLVRYNGGNVEEVYFPFCGTENDFEETVKRRHIDRAAPQVVDVIRSLKPYKGGNEALRSLHVMDIVDKHRLLIPVTAISSVPNFSTIVNGNPGISMQNCSIINPLDGAGVIAFPTPDNFEVGQFFEPTFDITFGDTQPFELEPIIPTLRQLAKMIDDILNKFSSMFRPTP